MKILKSQVFDSVRVQNHQLLNLQSRSHTDFISPPQRDKRERGSEIIFFVDKKNLKQIFNLFVAP